jgi:hypothetical protein
MQFVVCNVDTAASDALAFYARTKTFVNGSAAESPAPIWVSTNATYFHFPNIKIDTVAKTKRLEVKTAAPHLLANGSTLHTGNFTAFLPNGVLSDWKVQKTEESLKRLLAVTIEKAGQDTTVTPTFTISDTGVKVDFPRISYSSPVMKVGTVAETTATTVPAASSTTTTTTTVATSTKTIAKKKTVALTSLMKLVGKGAATWRVTGGCKIAGKSLVTPAKAAVCALTLRQAASGKTKASTRTLRIKVA